LLPSSQEDLRLQEQTLRDLQLGRERFKQLGRPIVLWMPEYTYSLIGQKAVDFWSWQTGVFFFMSQSIDTDDQQFKPFRSENNPYSFWNQFGTDNYILGPAEYRPQIGEVMSAIRKGRSVLVCGESDAGKTSLAHSIARRISAETTNLFPDGQLLINLDESRFADRDYSNFRVLEELRHVIRSLRPDLVALPDDLAGLVATYQHVLEGKRALIVVEGIADAEMLRLLIPPSNSVLLATSRAALMPPREMTIVDLDHLTDEQARQLLLRIVPSIDHAIADHICALCDYRPLAIRIAGGAITSQPDLAPDIYLKLIRERLDKVKGRYWKSSGEASVEATLSIAYEFLSPNLSLTFRKLAIFPTSFDPVAEEKICDDKENKYLNELVDRNIVLADGLTDRYSLHALVRQFAGRHLTIEEGVEIAKKHSWYFAQVLSTANEYYTRGGESAALGIKVFDAEWENIKTGQSWAATHIDQDSLALELCNFYPYAGKDLLELRQHPKERIPWLEAALSAAKILKDQKSEASLLCLIGIAYIALGEGANATDYFNQALDVARKVGSKHLESVALANLGSIYQEQGQQSEAINIYEQALVTAREINDHRNEVTILGRLGDSYVSLAKYTQAIGIFESSLDIVRKLGDVRHEATILSGLGNAYSSMGESRRAIQYYEQSLSLSRKIDYRHGAAAALSNLGLAYQNIGESSTAISFYEQALDIFREISDPRGEANATGNLAIAYAQLGDYKTAVERFSRMLEIVRELGNREGEALALCNLGFVFSTLGDNSRARTLFEQSLEIMRRIGDRHGEAKALSGIANTYVNVGDSTQAVSFYEQALNIDREIGSRRNEANVLNNLGSANANAGQIDKAISYFEQALSLAREIDGRRIKADALWNLSQAYYQLGNLSKARNYAEEALTVYNKIQDPNASKVLATLSGWPTPE